MDQSEKWRIENPLPLPGIKPPVIFLSLYMVDVQQTYETFQLPYFSAYKMHQRIGRILFFMQIFLEKNNFSIFYHAFIE
jgi:hypothetical protein